MPMPDALSMRVLDAIAPDEAELLAEDPLLRAESARRGVDLDEVIDRLSHPPTRRLATEQGLADFRLADLMDRLTAAGIRFVLIGGLAGRLYGSTLTTHDLDICHARDRDNLAALANMLRTLGADFRRPPQFAPAEISAATFATETDFIFTTSYGKFDLIGEFTGVGRYREASLDAAPAAFGRWDVRVLALAKLIASKHSTGRPRDALVAAELEVVALAAQRLERATRTAS